MWEYDYSTLCHHGILGQKWGVRRFQNPDGTLTPAGRRRYNMDLKVDKKHKLNKDFPSLKDFKKVSDDDIGEMYWTNYSEMSLELSPKEMQQRFPKSYQDLVNEIEQKSKNSKEFQFNRDTYKKKQKI